MSSILSDVKKLLGVPEDNTYFDPDIMLHINSALAILNQLGVGPDDGFFVSGESQTWEEFLGGDPRLNDTKSYVYLKVRLLFDPPASSTVVEAFKSNLSELEWRLSVAVSN